MVKRTAQLPHDAWFQLCIPSSPRYSLLCAFFFTKLSRSSATFQLSTRPPVTRPSPIKGPAQVVR